MSETPGSSGPATPAGWYPTGDGWERWWDGNAWSQHHVRQVQQAPTAYAAPPAGPGGYGSVPGQPYYVAPPGSGSSSATRTVLIVIGVILVLLVGGCVAVVAVVGVAVDGAVDTAVSTMETDDDAPGGADNPLEVTVGEAFSAQGFSWAAGWGTGVDGVGDLAITGLSVTNTGSESDYLSVDITFLRGTEQLAQASCSAASVEPGATAQPTCYSFDPVPTDYDTVTVQDSF